ncbi:MAG: hypothetical protein JNK21_04900 [Rhodospirillaceae bacterium]|nr:hypothetical protein [Rhodospirillaceae bacterium]
MKLTAIMWAALTVVVGVSLFLLKYQVQALEDQLQSTYAQIEKDKTAIRVLEAEWTYLNDPGRLRRLSEQYLGFVPPQGSQVITLSQLPYKNGQLPAEGVSTPVPAGPMNVPLTNVREASVSVPAESVPTFQLAAVTERPNVIANSIARLQGWLPATWTISTASAPLLQEPRR